MANDYDTWTSESVQSDTLRLRGYLHEIIRKMQIQENHRHALHFLFAGADHRLR